MLKTIFGKKVVQSNSIVELIRTKKFLEPIMYEIRVSGTLRFKTENKLLAKQHFEKAQRLNLNKKMVCKMLSSYECILHFHDLRGTDCPLLDNEEYEDVKGIYMMLSHITGSVHFTDSWNIFENWNAIRIKNKDYLAIEKE